MSRAHLAQQYAVEKVACKVSLVVDTASDISIYTQLLGHTPGLKEKRFSDATRSHPDGWQDAKRLSAGSDTRTLIVGGRLYESMGPLVRYQ